MIGRFLFLALLMFASVVLGDGTYQRTKNGKTLIWNDDPQPGDEAAWSGARDHEGYAHGFGTLAWYTKGNGTDSAKPDLYARYWGNMVQGKLDGPVNVHSKGKTRHAIFAGGIRMTRWEPGTGSSLEAARWRAVTARRSVVRGPEAPAEGPAPVEIKRTQSSGSEFVPKESSPDLAFNSPRARPLTDVSPPETETDVAESVRLLVWPPPVLGMRWLSTGPHLLAKARLTKEEVVVLADAAARLGGYDPAEYERPEPQYDPSDQAWSLSYEENPSDKTDAIGKHLSIAVGDKTKQTALAPGK
jgi:hypothetical protein